MLCFSVSFIYLFTFYLFIYGSELANFHMSLANPAHVYNIEWLCIVGLILIQFYSIEDHATPTVVVPRSAQSCKFVMLFVSLLISDYFVFFFVFFPKL